jgi:hypothetical protein
MDPSFMADGILTPEHAAEIKKLWLHDKGLKAVYNRGTEFHLLESAP